MPDYIEHPEYVVWLVLALALSGLVVAILLRWVPQGHALVVTRRGLVSRVRGSGPALRLRPDADAHLVATEPGELPLLVRGTTADGTSVRMVVRAQVRAVLPEPGTPYRDPVVAAVPAAEGVLRRAIEDAPGDDLTDLPIRLRRSWPSLTGLADRETSPLGLRILGLELLELDVVLLDADVRPPSSALDAGQAPADPSALCGDGVGAR
ncbi:hypothetical protein [Nocardioides sp. GXZ039]|uniref:hypothetical protein n=1 Tax=Nocardioides sp. GXZ039 TaxID=3136018 RepID=UPI0030F3BA1C